MYAADFSGLLEAVGARDTALMTIKTIARRNWQDDEQHRYDTWYAPFDEQRYISAAVTWVLKTYPQVTGIATAGETRLLRQMIVAEAASDGMSVQDAARVLDEVQDYASPFISMPF